MAKGDTTIASDDELFSSLCRFLDPNHSHYTYLTCRGRWRWRDIRLPNWINIPSPPDAAVLANLTYFGLYATTAAFLLRYSAASIERMCLACRPPHHRIPLLCRLCHGYNQHFLALLEDRGVEVDNLHALNCWYDVDGAFFPRQPFPRLAPFWGELPF